MNEASINQLHESIMALIEQKRLKEAQAQLQTLAEQSAYWDLTEHLEQNKTSYNYMLEYLEQGTNDPQRPKLHRRLCLELRELADLARLFALDKVSPAYYHEQRRLRAHQQKSSSIEGWLNILQNQADNIALCQLPPHNGNVPDELLHTYEASARQFFIDIWTADPWTAEDSQQARQWLETPGVPAQALCLMTSAVGMSLLEILDPAKVQWLLTATLPMDPDVSERALVGLTLALMHWGKRVDDYKDLCDLICIHERKYDLARRMNTVIIQLLRSRDTARIDRKMQEEIMPVVMKNKDLFRRLSFGPEKEEADINPDWDEALDKTGLTDTLREMNDLQLEGNDVFMSTFKNLKAFPFFQEMPNWFLPFDPGHSAVASILSQVDGPGNILKPMLDGGVACNSDKYSITLMMQHLPAPQREMMLAEMNRQYGNVPIDEERYALLTENAREPETVSRQYIHDLYRFFKLFRRKADFQDPFCDNMDPYAGEILALILEQQPLMRQVGGLLIRQQRWEQAKDVYERLDDLEEPNAETYQRIGLCRQKQKDYQGAIFAYEAADDIKPDSLWNLRHLATCHRMLGQYDEALLTYERILRICPDDLDMTYHQAICHLAMQLYEEAQGYFFRLDLGEEHSLRAWRGIAWCALMLGKNEQAAKYYGRIPEQERTADDWLNLGHVHLVTADPARAASCYRRASSLYGSHAKLRKAFFHDRNTLRELGVKPDDMPLIMDLVL